MPWFASQKEIETGAPACVSRVLGAASRLEDVFLSACLLFDEPPPQPKSMIAVKATATGPSFTS